MHLMNNPRGKKDLTIEGIKSRLREIRICAGVELLDIEALTGVSVSTLRRLDNPLNTTACDFLTFAKVCQALEVNSEYILFGETHQNTPMDFAHKKILEQLIHMTPERRKSLMKLLESE